MTIFIIGAIFCMAISLFIELKTKNNAVSRRLSAFVPQNDSIIECIKLIFWPMILFSAAEYFDYGQYFDNFISAKAISVFAGMAWFTMLYTVYNAIWHRQNKTTVCIMLVISQIIAYVVNYVAIDSYAFYSSADKAFGTVFVLLFMTYFCVLPVIPQGIFQRKRAK